jgi:hypothetical protein
MFEIGPWYNNPRVVYQEHAEALRGMRFSVMGEGANLARAWCISER